MPCRMSVATTLIVAGSMRPKAAAIFGAYAQRCASSEVAILKYNGDLNHGIAAGCSFMGFHSVLFR